MAFSFDSQATAVGVVLAASVGAGVWLCRDARKSVRAHFHFAQTLFAAFAVAALAAAMVPALAALAYAMALLAISLGTAAFLIGLAASLGRSLPAWAASIALVVSLGAGLAAMLADAPLLALSCQLACVGAMLALAAARHGAGGWQTMLGAGLLLLGGMALVEGATGAAALFFAGAMLGLARGLQLRVQPRGADMLFAGIGRQPL
jgi:hypothetical protein